jgi:DNA-directed RNA polymerase specialized sigma24 family protein
MDAVNERELVERCRSGDERAFQDLVDLYKDLVYALIARTVQDRSRAEDLAQDVFLRIHRGLPYFRGEARLSTWIYRIVANVCVQEFGRPAAISLDDESSAHQAAASARYEDLADALQLPLGTVKTQLYRAKQQLRRMLETDLR